MSQENNKRPSFQFYPTDWLSDPNTNAMTAEEEGAYIRLLCYMWNTEDCSLRNDEEYLAKLGRVDKVVIRSLYPCFKVVTRGLRHKRLDYERKKQDEYREKCSIAGKKGMSHRWKGAKEASKNKVVITKNNSSSSTSSSTSSIKESSTKIEQARVEIQKENISLKESSDTPLIVPAARAEYGNQKINDLLSLLREKIGVDDFKESVRYQRIWGKNLVSLMEKISPSEFGRRLEVLLNDDFMRKNCNKLEYIFREIRGFIEPQDTIKSVII